MEKQDFYVIAHNIRSLHNVGSIFRTADAFGVTKIYLTGYTGRPDHPVHAAKLGKVALGAEYFVPWEFHKSPIKLLKDLKLKNRKIRIIGLENNTKSIPITKFKPQFPLVLILGEERRGVSHSIIKLCDKVVEIPMFGKKESLNVSVAFGIAAFWIQAKDK